VVTLVPQVCDGCGQALLQKDGEPVRHQVVEVPPLGPQVTEYRCHLGHCPKCGTTTRAKLPPGVPTTCLGPRLCALLVLLTGKFHLSKRRVEELLWDVLGAKLSLGAVCKVEKTLSQALKEPVQEAMDTVPFSPVVHQDETSWCQQNRKAWLWVAVTAVVTVFRIAFRRGRKVCQQMLGNDYGGTLVTDRWSAYLFVDDSKRQFCWAHLLRDFEELVAGGGDGARLGTELLGQARRLFRLWHRVRDQTLSFETFQRKVAPIRQAVQELLRQGALFYSGKAKTLSQQLLRHEPALWRFTREPGIEPTNNAAERALRQAVKRGSLCVTPSRCWRCEARLVGSKGSRSLRLQPAAA